MNLYSRRKFLTSLILLALAFTTIIVSAQRRSRHKLRATAVLEVTTDPAGVISTRVFPVTVLDEGRFQDASTYKGAPRPMAIDNGIVYEAQKSGVAKGWVTVINSVNNNGWTALGKWSAITEAKKTEKPAATVDTSNDRPILHHGDAANATSTPTPAPNASPTPEQEQSSAPHVDTERPMLKRRDAGPEPSPTPAATASATKPGEVTAPRKELPVIAAGTRTYIGISDTQSSDSRSFDFPWKPGEEQQTEVKMRKLLLAQLPRENTPVTADSLKNVSMRSFDLDLSNDAVVVMSAEIPGSLGVKGESAKPATRYVTVIARVDFEGVPQKLTSSVTDSSRLDVAPRLELVDAVDVDGDGQAELLFREYSFDQESFIVYSVGRNSVTKVFEGASMQIGQ